MNFRPFEIFCDVATLGSFSKAARARGISQSAVSQAVGHLEESLGVKLFDRSSRPLAVTKAGKRYHQGLRELLANYQQLESEVVSAGRSLEGTLHVAAIYSVGLSYMPDATDEFGQMFPEVDVRVDYGHNETVIDRVMLGDAEIGLVSFPKTTRDVIAVPWQKEPMRLVCAPKHPLAAQAETDLSVLDGMEMVGFERGLQLRQMIDQEIKRAGIRVDFQTEFDNIDTIVRAIQANNGIGFLPEAAVRRETATGALKVVACRGLSMTRPLGIIFRRTRRPNRAGHEFGSLLLGRPLEPDRGKRPHLDAGAEKLANASLTSVTSVIA